jgi:hypothetical protein
MGSARHRHRRVDHDHGGAARRLSVAAPRYDPGTASGLSVAPHPPRAIPPEWRSRQHTMLFRHDILQGIAEGRVTLAFRRWRRAPPVDGASVRTPIGVLRLDRVTVVDEGDITAEDVGRTGMSPAELRASLAGQGTLLRIELRLAGDDPRIALRSRLPDPAEIESVAARLRRIDAASQMPWTTRYLRLIAEQPGVVSHALARQVKLDTLPFKRRVRRLKELGLTESLEVGYRLSPRGRAVLDRLETANT